MCRYYVLGYIAIIKIKTNHDFFHKHNIDPFQTPVKIGFDQIRNKILL